MNVLKIINKQTFPNYSCFNFDDGTCTNKGIILLNRVSNVVYRIDNNSKFTLYNLKIKIYKLCYDECEDCYWALLAFDYSNIYKLNKHFREMSYIQLNYPIDNPIEICDMSYCKADNLFILTTTKCVFKFDKSGNCTEKIYENNSLKTYISAYCFCNYTYILFYENKKAYISILKDGKEIKCYEILCSFTPSSIIYIEKDKNSKNEIITLTAKADNSNKIHLISLSPDCEDNSAIPCVSKALDNEDMVDSIVSIENSLAHLLDLESEKLEKGIKLADSVEELLKLNENLTEIIINITQLEYLFMTRLKALDDSK